MSQKLRRVGVAIPAMVAVAALVLGVINRYCPPEGPSERPIRQAIAAEAAAAKEGDVDKAVSLYAPGAVVRDAGAGATWSGLPEIRRRYSDLPKFNKLDHVDVTVTFDEHGEFARAVASTAGVIVNEDGSTSPVSSVDAERWSFEKIEGRWKVVSFTYDAR